VWGVGDVIGTADIEGMLYYYLEYKALSTDLSIPENGPWVPVTSAMSAPVVNGSLATLDTTIVPDGTYALRLTVNTEDNASYHYIVSPCVLAMPALTPLLHALSMKHLTASKPTTIMTKLRSMLPVLHLCQLWRHLRIIFLA
jgi:hypothetical protein